MNSKYAFLVISLVFSDSQNFKSLEFGANYNDVYFSDSFDEGKICKKESEIDKLMNEQDKDGNSLNCAEKTKGKIFDSVSQAVQCSFLGDKEVQLEECKAEITKKLINKCHPSEYNQVK